MFVCLSEFPLSLDFQQLQRLVTATHCSSFPFGVLLVLPYGEKESQCSVGISVLGVLSEGSDFKVMLLAKVLMLLPVANENDCGFLVDEVNCSITLL